MKLLLWRTLALACTFPVLIAGASEERKIEAAALPLAAQVRAIFEAKCVECHGADLVRPKGKFGYVLDLARVAANPKMVTPGSADDSDLYLLVEDDEMPGEEAKSPPLTPTEKQIVKQWIDSGAQVEKVSNIASRKPATALSAPPSLTMTRRLVRFAGQFHPPSSHFPIALLIAALPAEFMWKLTRKRSWKATVRFCVCLGAASAVLTASLGWCDAIFTNYTGSSAPLLAWHRWLGTATAVWAVLTAALSEIAHREDHPRGLRYGFRATLLVGIALVSVAGYLGASLIYGLDHFKW